MAPQLTSRHQKEEIIVQEFGSSATSDGSRKRRKSIHTTPTKLNGNANTRKIGVEINGTTITTMNGNTSSPKGKKVNGAANGIGSRGMLVVGK